MMDWGLLLLPGAVLLLIPITIVAGYRRATGSIMATAALATVAFAVFWLALGGIDELETGTDPGFLIRLAFLYGGILITLAAWILSLNAAAQARRWVWVGLLLVAGYLTLAAIYASFSIQTCFSPGPEGGLACPPPDTLRQALTFLGYLSCPVVALIYSFYGTRAFRRRVRTLPDGLTISSLRASPAEDVSATSPTSDAS